MKLRRAKCPECGKVCAVQTPMGGDGSCDVFPRHGRSGHTPGERLSSFCPESRQEVLPDHYVESTP